MPVSLWIFTLPEMVSFQTTWHDTIIFFLQVFFFFPQKSWIILHILIADQRGVHSHVKKQDTSHREFFKSVSYHWSLITFLEACANGLTFKAQKTNNETTPFFPGIEDISIPILNWRNRHKETIWLNQVGTTCQTHTQNYPTVLPRFLEMDLTMSLNTPAEAE